MNIFRVAAGVLTACSGAYAGISWGSAQMLSDPVMTDTSGSGVSMDAAGNAVVLVRNHERQPNDRFFYQASSCPPGGPCTSLQSVSQATAQYGVLSGVCAIWNRFNTTLGDWQEEIGCYVDGMWPYPITFQNSLTKSPGTSALAVNNTGYGVAVWPSDNGTFTSLQGSFIPGVGMDPEPFEQISLDNFSASSPCAVVDAAGNAMVIFVSKSSMPGTWIMATSCPYRGFWSTPQKISPTSFINNVGTPMMDIDESGKIIAAWLDANNNMGLSLFTQDGGWGTPVTMSNPSSGPANSTITPFVDVKVTPSGTPFATAVIGCPDGSIWAVDIAANATLGTPQQLSESGKMGTFPRIAIDSTSGNALVAWREFDPRNPSYAPIRERVAGGAWGDIKIAGEGWNVADVRIAYNGGHAVIAYNAIPALDNFSANSALFVIQGRDTDHKKGLKEGDLPPKKVPKKNSWWPWDKD